MPRMPRGADSRGTRRLGIGEGDLARAAELLRSGELVAFPTETVYGLGARADDGAAVRSIFAAKGRPSNNPLIIHVASVDAARALTSSWPDAATALAEAFWPGPLTLVLPRRVAGGISNEAAAGGPTVALRVPVHPVALALLCATGLPLAAPSANRSTTISPTTADHVRKTLDGRIAAIVDAGPTGFGIESTIVDVTRAPAVLLRRGALSIAELRAVTPIVDHGDSVVADGDRSVAPGAFARHYAPNATLRVVAADQVEHELESLRARGLRVGCVKRSASPADTKEASVIAMPDEPIAYAALLYATLHALDDAGYQAIVLEAPPRDEAWDAVRDRLSRASASA